MIDKVLLISGSLLVAILLKKLYSHIFGKDNLGHIPGPTGLPILGYFPFLGRRVHVTLTRLWSEYGDVYQIKVGARRIVVLNGNDTIRNAFVNKAFDFAGRPNFYTYEVASRDDLIGISDYSDRYRVAKKLLLKAFGAFSNEKKCELQEAAHKSVERLINLAKQAANEPFDPAPYMYPIVCSIMGYVCWGDFFDIDDERVNNILGNANEFGSAMAFGVACDYFPYLKRFFKHKLRKLELLIDTIREYTSKLANDHVETYDGKNMRDITDFFHQAADQMDDERKSTLNLDKKALLSLPGSIFGAGFATIAITTKWSILLLAKHPQFQDNMQNELDRVVGAERYASLEDADKLPYSMAVIYEVYRYSSIAPLAFAHKTLSDTNINGYNIPNGTTVVANFYSAHRDALYFKDPYKFDPERFLDDSKRELNKVMVGKIAPYGLGTRRCGGEIVARLEIFTFIATLIQRCRIEETPEFPLNLDNYKTTLALDPGPFKVVMKSRFNEW